MVQIEVYQGDKLVATLDCPFEHDKLVESLQYNGYSTKILVNGVVTSVVIAK